LIETALIGLVFFFLLIGAFDFGQFLFIHQALVERARSSVRWGAVTLAANESTSLDQIRNMVLYNQSTSLGGSGYFGLTSAMVDVTKTTDTLCTVSGSDPMLYVRFIVKIHDYPYQILSPYIAGSYNGPNITIGAPVEQDFSTVASTCP